MSGRIGAAPRLAHQLLPLGARQSAIVEIGAGPFAAVVEEALVVVLRLKRLDLGLDEAIELGEITDKLRRYVEIHGSLLLTFLRSRRCLLSTCGAAVGGVVRLIDGHGVHRRGPEMLDPRLVACGAFC